jgi:hypothetical protein
MAALMDRVVTATREEAAIAEVFALCSTVLAASERSSNIVVDLLCRHDAHDLDQLVESGVISRDACRCLIALARAGDAVAEAY